MYNATLNANTPIHISRSFIFMHTLVRILISSTVPEIRIHSFSYTIFWKKLQTAQLQMSCMRIYGCTCWRNTNWSSNCYLRANRSRRKKETEEERVAFNRWNWRWNLTLCWARENSSPNWQRKLTAVIPSTSDDCRNWNSLANHKVDDETRLRMYVL